MRAAAEMLSNSRAGRVPIRFSATILRYLAIVRTLIGAKASLLSED